MRHFKVKTLNSVYSLEENDAGERRIIGVTGDSDHRYYRRVRDHIVIGLISAGNCMLTSDWSTSRVVEIIDAEN